MNTEGLYCALIRILNNINESERVTVAEMPVPTYTLPCASSHDVMSLPRERTVETVQRLKHLLYEGEAQSSEPQNTCRCPVGVKS